MQRLYYSWIAELRDGTRVTEAEGRSLYRPLPLDVKTLTLVPNEGCSLLPHTVTVPEGGRLVYSKTRRGVVGFEPNKNFPGLWYMVTSHPIAKQVAELVRDWELANPGFSQEDRDKQQAAYFQAIEQGTLGDHILRQCASGMTATLDELLSFDVYAIGWENAAGLRSIQYIAPTGESEITDGTEIIFANDGRFELLNSPGLIERVFQQGVEHYREKILAKIDRALEEIASFKNVLNNL